MARACCIAFLNVEILFKSLPNTALNSSFKNGMNAITFGVSPEAFCPDPEVSSLTPDVDAGDGLCTGVGTG